MNLSIRMRVSFAASVVVAAGLVGCQTTRDYIDHRFPQMNLPRPSMPSFDEMVPFSKSKPRTHAEPYQPPKLEPVPDAQEPLILPAPASTNSRSRGTSRPVSAPPALPPFEAETPVPSAGLFPSGPVRSAGWALKRRVSSKIRTLFKRAVVHRSCRAAARRLVAQHPAVRHRAAQLAAV
jgi:hypothetical protein